jgi:transcriptional regulator with XRE-family HTH domain
MGTTRMQGTNTSNGTYADLASLVRALREGRNWSQEALAEAAGIKVRTIQRVENGEPTNVQTKRSLARAFEFDDIDAFDNLPTPKYTIWFVDDLKSNLQRFENRHLLSDFKVRTFGEPDEVMAALDAGEHPDALLIDVFFYESKTDYFEKDTPEEVEKIVTDLVEQLRNKWFARDEYARGINLMERITDKIKAGHIRPFVRYAYRTKAPYLLQLPAWKRIHDAGAAVLIKNSLVAGDERIRFREDINRNTETWQSRLTKGVREAVHPTNLGRLFVSSVVSALAGGVAGFFLKSWLSTALH